MTPREYYAKKYFFQRSLDGKPWTDERFNIYDRVIVKPDDNVVMRGFLRHITVLTDAQEQYLENTLNVSKNSQSDVVIKLEECLQAMWSEDEEVTLRQSIYDSSIKNDNTQLTTIVASLVKESSIEIAILTKNKDEKINAVTEFDLIEIFCDKIIKYVTSYKDFINILISENIIERFIIDEDNNRVAEINKSAYERFIK